MILALSSINSENLERFLENCVKRGVKHVEIDKKSVIGNEDVIARYNNKLNFVNIHTGFKDYKYTLFLAESLNCDMISISISSQDDYYRLKEVINQARSLNIKVCAENTLGLNNPVRIKEVLSRLDERFSGFMINTSIAYEHDKTLSSYVKTIRHLIMGIHVSDVYNEFRGLPVSLGEQEYLKKLILHFKNSKIPWIVKLSPEYGFKDALISMKKLKKYSDSIKTLL